MRHDDMVCASCSGRVADGRCPVCRSTREQLRGVIDWQALLVPILALVALIIGITAYYVRVA
jgi:hypothetical protein